MLLKGRLGGYVAERKTGGAMLLKGRLGGYVAERKTGGLCC